MTNQYSLVLINLGLLITQGDTLTQAITDALSGGSVNILLDPAAPAIGNLDINDKFYNHKTAYINYKESLNAIVHESPVDKNHWENILKLKEADMVFVERRKVILNAYCILLYVQQYIID